MTSAVHTDTELPPPVEEPARPAPARRTPTAVWLLAAVSGVQALGLLTLGLVGMNTVRTLAERPSGLLVGAVMVGLAGWVVLVAGAAATLLDGAGRLLVLSVSTGELVLAGSLALLGAGRSVTLDVGPWQQLPVPALCLLAALLPAAKTVLAGAPSVTAWSASGGRVVRRRPAPPSLSPRQRRLQLVTVLAIAAVLTGVALLAPSAPTTSGTTTSGVVSAP